MNAQIDGAANDAKDSGGIGLFAAWYAVAVLLLFYIFSTIDRSIITMMVQPLERDLHIGDFQIGLLQGPAFGIFYVLCGLPMGYLVDRFSRRWITAIGVVVWGLATCFCGLAASVPQLFAARMGVGFGESALTPAAHSMISEKFPPRSLAMAISVFTLGSVIGAGIALAVGGSVVHIVTHMKPVVLPVVGAVRAWQLAFLMVGIPTLALTPLIFTIKENVRPRLAAAEQARADGKGSFFRSHWRLALGIPFAFGLTNIICQALNAWVPTYIIRTFHWNPAQVGLAFGMVLLIGGASGQMVGAAVVDWLYSRGVRDAHVRYHWFALLITVPCAVGAFFVPNPIVFLALIAVFYIFSYPFVGYAAAALQIFAPQNVRGRVSALFLAIVTVVGTAFGPTVPAYLTDNLFHEKAKLGLSLAIVVAITGLLIVAMMLVMAAVMRAAHARRDALTTG